jgi:1-acyl-sn-glycerol-3-phosphate acyltransferase
MTYWLYYISKFCLWLFFRIGFGLEVSGQEHVPRCGAFVLASNHLSYLDPPVLGVACPRPVSFMARDTLFRHPFLGAYLRAVRVIALKRGESDITALRRAIEQLKAGQAVALFPEGTRGETTDIRPAKRGIDILAAKAQVPVVPVFIQGTFEALPRNRKCLQRAKIRVAFGPALQYNEAPSLAEAVTHRWRDLAAKLGFPEAGKP